MGLMTKVGISFKDSERELLEYLKSKLSPSIYIKELIKKDMEANRGTVQATKRERRGFDF